MNQVKHWGLRYVHTFLLCMILFQSGCAAVRAIKGKPGLGVSAIKAGASKSEVEEILGSPVHEWITSEGIRYCVYGYDKGIPSSIGDATAHAFMDVATLGVWEIVFLKDPDKALSPGRLIKEQIAVAYDDEEIVVGVFDHFGDFDYLPPDGRPRK